MARRTQKQLDDEMKGKIRQTTLSYKNASENAKRGRMDQNQINFDAYLLRQDWSHKENGQSTEFLPRVALSVEQIASFIQQALVDLGEWFSVDKRAGIPAVELMDVRPEDIRKILLVYLKKADFYNVINDVVKLGLVGSLMIVKVDGEFVPKPKFRAKGKKGSLRKTLVKTTQKVWEMRIRTIRQEDYFPDPTGRKLYEGQRITMDIHKIKALSEGPNAIYDPDVVEKLLATHGTSMQSATSGTDETQKFKKRREQDQNQATESIRREVDIFEWHGDIIDPATGELLFENVMWTTSRDFEHLLQPPTPNAFWHGKSPFIVAPILRVPNSVWHKALMDAPTFLNKALNEYFNLMLDGGLMSVHGIKQLRKDLLDDESQVDNGIAPGDTLDISATTPPGVKVLETVVTGNVPPDAINIFQATNAEYQQAALTNDLRLGQLPPRSVKATEVVEASQSLNSVFNAVGKNIEAGFITPLLELAIMTIGQHANDLDSDEIISSLGITRARAVAALTPAELFAAIVNGFKFKVTGISAILTKGNDFRKLTSFLQTVSSSDVLVQEFAKKFDFGKLLEEILKSLDISPDKIKLSEDEQALAAQQQAQAPQPGQPQAGQNQVNNVKSAATLGEVLGQNIPREEFARGSQPIRGES